ncbi:aspartate--tRNA ligase [Candidatus Aerophobetes bacterium]|uniref:Aspartate--tRNA(Asp/Asn) ligase n=1 Tax=Aerophobetes bacterium TaxID=2030807 RepID=A0A2A4YLW6_UNCAE|nr:MAG: aspartate--tRNA ligase [Candidatus Aerophobetes bacterium]
MHDYRRTHSCGDLNKTHAGETVTLSGWVHKRRDLGGLTFVDLRDRYGITQLIFDPNKNADLHKLAGNLKHESVISIEGIVHPRVEGMANKNMVTGEIEIEVSHLELLSESLVPPFTLNDDTYEVNEELRLKYRYLDIRKGNLLKNLTIRHKAMVATRRFLDGEKFTEVQTPIMSKSTPEGAREYLVPSRIHPAHFYALPQSPQIYKQLLMISGLDRYFQIAPCFRDEDLRAERQPEFTQIDIEMSFGKPEDIKKLTEGMLKEIFKECLNVEIETPIPVMSYHDCLENYGTDKPDVRFDMPLVRVDDIVKDSTFSIFTDQLKNEGCIKGICVKGGAEISRKGIDVYTEFVSRLGLKGLAWMKKQNGEFSSSIVKFFPSELLDKLSNVLHVEDGDMILFAAAKESVVNQALDHLRRHIAKERKLIPENAYKFLWVNDFPLFEFDEEENRLTSIHHPFTSPHFDDIKLIDEDPLNVRSDAYDCVLNGFEIGGGSQRIHNQELQKKIFKTLNLSEDDIKTRMGFFIEALQYGTPPHLGIAFGLDRIAMILCNTDNIKDVIAFPKSLNATDLMMQSPSMVEKVQLDELKIKTLAEEISVI